MVVWSLELELGKGRSDAQWSRTVGVEMAWHVDGLNQLELGELNDLTDGK